MLDLYAIGKEVEKIIEKGCVSFACRVELAHNTLSIHTSDDCTLDVEVDTFSEVVEVLEQVLIEVNRLGFSSDDNSLYQFSKVLNKSIEYYQIR